MVDETPATDSLEVWFQQMCDKARNTVEYWQEMAEIEHGEVIVLQQRVAKLERERDAERDEKDKRIEELEAHIDDLVQGLIKAGEKVNEAVKNPDAVYWKHSVEIERQLTEKAERERGEARETLDVEKQHLLRAFNSSAEWERRCKEARKERANLLDLLRRVEWVAELQDYLWEDCCPDCRRRKEEGHAPGCELARALQVDRASAAKGGA
jgi:hypothetical protein